MSVANGSSASLHPASGRHDRLDGLRGLAMLWMAGFHLCYDLNLYGLIAAQDFNRDAVWLHQRTAIVSLFLLCAGMSQALALARPTRWRFAPTWGRRFLRRWLQVAACAVLVSAGSAVMFPSSWITFGVLHGVAIMLLLLRVLAPLRHGLWALAALALVLPWWVRHPWFDSPWSNWLGLVTHKPVTVDWVPVLPWLAVMLLGLLLGRWMFRPQGRWWRAGLPSALQPVAALGRWPLTFYMVHQPVLLGALQLGRWCAWW